LCHLDVSLGCIRAHHFGSETRHRLAQKASAAANIEYPQTLERLSCARITPEPGRDMVADIGQANGVELVQRAELAVRVPPFRCQRRKTLDLAGIDGASSDIGHGFACSPFQIRARACLSGKGGFSRRHEVGWRGANVKFGFLSMMRS